MAQPAYENRRHVRRQTDRPVRFALADGTERAGTCRDISLGGADIETDECVSVGAKVEIRIELDGIEGGTILSATVRWTRPHFMGVQFDFFGPRITHAIIRMLADLGN